MSSSFPSMTTQDISSRSSRDQYAPPSLDHLSIWAYIALAFVIFLGTGILVYAIYSCFHSARNNDVIIGAGHAANEKISSPFKRSNWRSTRQNCGSQQAMIAEHKSSFPLRDESPFDFPSLTKPPLVHAVRHTPHTLPSVIPRSTEPPSPIKSPTMFDSNNIRFVAPPNPMMSTDATDMWTNPKLSPVQGSITLPPNRPNPRRSFCRC